MDGKYPIVHAYSVSSPDMYDTVSERIACEINEGGCREYLSKWPVGFQDAMVASLTKMPIRFVIADDSGSMSINDGNRMVEAGKDTKMISCSRWSELVSTLRFQVGLARAANAHTEFRFLNGAEPLTLGKSSGGADEQVAYQTMMAVLDEGPRGGTPLCRQITAIIEEVRAMERTLRARRQLACIIIATDGEASDGDLAVAMAPLKDLPVWVVIRLCTDDEKVCSYWNDIDKQLELDMDVLDDYAGEAEEVQKANPWLTYGLPFHRMREFGVSVKEMDLLDESLLSVEQMKVVTKLIYGRGVYEAIVPPEVDMVKFVKGIDKFNKDIPNVYCPIKNKFMPWINPKQLQKIYGKDGNCTVC